MIRGIDDFGSDKEEGATGGVSVNFSLDVRRLSSRKESHDTDTGSFTYEHFPVVCPTCRGSGKVHEDDVNELVAFVPVKDERLRPSRIFWKLLLMLAICACIAAPLAFFLVPRSVTMTLMDVKATKIFMPDNKNLTPYIMVNTNLKIVNQNYLSIKIKDVNQKVAWDQLILNPKTCLRNLSLEVPSRDHLNQPMEIKIAFEGSKSGTAGFRVRSLCGDGWLNRIMMKFVTTATVSFLTQSSQISVTKYNYVQCYNYTGFSQDPWTNRKRKSLLPLWQLLSHRRDHHRWKLLEERTSNLKQP